MNLKLAPTVLALLCLAAIPAVAESAPPWFDRLIDVEPLPPAAEQELARVVSSSFLEPASPQPLPPILRQDRTPRMIFASYSDGRSPARVVRGAGQGARAAIKRLLEQRGEAPPARWVKVDVVRDVVRETGLAPDRPLNLPRSLFGLAFEPGVGAAFLPGELVAQTLVDSSQQLRLKKIAARLDTVSQAEALGRAAVSRALDVYRFATSSYFSDGTEIVPLYRGHRRFEELTPELLLEAARRGGEYLTRAVGADGRFVYSYRPKTDEQRDKYNILRHAGTIYSMIELYEVTGDKRLLAAAERAIAYIGRTVKPCPGDAEIDAGALCVVEKGFVKLGGNALAIIALVKHAEVTGSGAHLPLIERLGLWILATQSEAGEFVAHKVHQATGKLDDHVSQYYPGEALLALLRGSQLRNTLHNSTMGGDRWLDAAARGARWLIEVRDRRVPDARLNHDHWLLYALNELHRRQPEPLYRAHAERTTGAILRLQNRRPPYPDWHGSYYHPPRSTPTATRSEGLAAAYLLQRDFGEKGEAAPLLEGLELGVRFQLGTQFGPESVLYLPDPRQPLGGFRRSLNNYEIRIDYVQHNISALLLLRRILLEQAAAAH